MAIFAYKAIAATGEVVEGRLECATQREVIDRLHALGHTPIRADEQAQAAYKGLDVVGWLRKSKQPTHKDITEFTRQLSILLEAGLELDRALAIQIDVADKEPMQRMLTDIQQRIRGGGALSEAMEAQGNVFSNLYLQMVKAGEAGGALDVMLQRLTDYLERSEELRESVKSALIYPFILICVAGLSVVILLTFVLPKFTQLFEDMGATLPLPTQIVIATGNFLSAYGWLILLALGAAYLALKQWLSDPEKRYRWDAGLLKLPILSDLLIKLEVARFSQTLGTLLANGVALLDALGIVKDVLSNRVLAGAMDQVIESLKHGGGLAHPLAQTGVYPREMIHLLKVGEETGELEKMLLKLNGLYTMEVQRTTTRMLAILEPVLILGLGMVIAGIIVSILLAILGINDLPL